MEQLSQWLWKQEYWLPPGIRWEDMEKMEGSRRPLPRDLLLALPLALGFIMLRYAFERCVAFPLSRVLGVKDQVRLKVTPAPNLETFYTKNSRQPTQVSLVNQCDLTHRQVETWFRNRRNLDRPSNSKKFCEASWRFVFYLVAFTAGLVSLINVSRHLKSYSLVNPCPVQDAHYWYYMLELGFYWSLLLCVSVDVKRKDFKEQIVHHFATIFLLGFSYCSNYIRIGTLVMLVHDSSDFLLEVRARPLSHAFMLTNTEIIYTTLVLSMEVFEPFMGYYFFNALLLLLQALHIYWAYLILRMIYKFLFLGKVSQSFRPSYLHVSLSKAPNPQLLPGGRRINGCPLLRVCVHCCVCALWMG
uniref:Ceramide synthase 4b n=1 Tax=Cyprinus carpio TaxID=7962 RepID=A0A8C1RH87_CYPCA